MSKFDLLSKEEDAEAAAQGWALQRIYDMESSKWRVMVVTLHPSIPHAEAAGTLVVGMARNNVPLALKALRLIQTSNQGTK